MEMKITIGVDNGVSGSVAVVTPSGECVQFFPMPVFLSQDYTKTKKNLNRIATNLLNDEIKEYAEHNEVTVLLERPMVNPMRFQATSSALRALEATLIVVEALQYRIIFIDSRQWQKELLPSGCKGEELKRASRDIGKRLFPKWSSVINKVGDADGLLIARWGQLHNL
jgi:hypothetical protein